MAEDTSSVAAPPAVAPVAIFKRRGGKGKANFRKRPATPPNADKGDDSSDLSSSEDEGGQRIKRRKKNRTAVMASSKDARAADNTPIATFTADRSVPLNSSNDATKQTNWYDENPKDGPSPRNLSGSSRNNGTGAQGRDGTYKGLSNQSSFIEKNPNAPTRTVGPVKAPTNIRTVTTTDFAPDVCKDYKTTGFCGFGDSCKFLHSRDDYKQGWQLDREWENVTKGKKVSGTVIASADRSKPQEDDDDDDNAMLENIPFACIICKGPYKSPIVTRCGHYFCEPCALKRYRRDPSCAACGSGTNGVFNSAKRLQKLLDRKRARAAKRRQEAIEAGEEVSEEEEEA